MISKDNRKLLDTMLKTTSPYLFLGAGFSKGARCKGGNFPSGDELCQKLIDALLIGQLKENEIDETKKYNLRDLCQCIDDIYGDSKPRENYLTAFFSCSHSAGNKFHDKLISYPWRRIYTVNIDDLIESVCHKAGIRFTSFHSARKTNPTEQLEIIKLHGCVLYPEDGYTFSRDEYNTLITSHADSRFLQFVEDIGSHDVIFIGASLDEPDLDYYLKFYENLGPDKRTNQLVFIDPYPSLRLKNQVQRLQARLVECNTEEFLSFATELNYDPRMLERLTTDLATKGFPRLAKIEEDDIFKHPYESKIYEGYFVEWQDVYDGWTFEDHRFSECVTKMNKLISLPASVVCLALYGEAFSGKSVLLRQLGHLLRTKHFEVIEFVGRRFETSVVINFVKRTDFCNYALLVDDGASYFPEIERLLNTNFGNKRLLIITSNREYKFRKREYYLNKTRGTVNKLKITDQIVPTDVDVIVEVLQKNGMLGKYYGMDERMRFDKILQKGSITNLLIDLTYGPGFQKRVTEHFNRSAQLKDNERKLLLELAIFDSVDVQRYPMPLYGQRYGSVVRLTRNMENTDNGLLGSHVVDYVRYNNRGISLKNEFMRRLILESVSKKQVSSLISDILLYIAPRIHEAVYDEWTIIFQSLCDGGALRHKMNLSNKQIDNILYGLKDAYEENSFYWLHLGLHEQTQNRFSTAKAHLEISKAIRPHAFQIQHAIARNYMVWANHTTNPQRSEQLFCEGEKMIKDLIDGKERYILRALPYSVHTYISEKEKYVRHHGMTCSNVELRYMCDALERARSYDDEYVKDAMRIYYNLLKDMGKTSILSMGINSPYLQFLKEDAIL